MASKTSCRGYFLKNVSQDFISDCVSDLKPCSRNLSMIRISLGVTLGRALRIERNRVRVLMAVSCFGEI